MDHPNRESQKWPDTIWLIRHGESAGNVARAEAEALGRAMIETVSRDADIPLSPLGRRQAAAVGQWFGNLNPKEQPTVVLVSPYERTQETAGILLENAGIDPDEITFILDERLREKEFGIFDRMTKVGIREIYPEQADAYSALGKFYHRPPGGESWCDIILRLRSVNATVTREYSRERVLIVAHQVVINCFRYLYERMTEQQILDADRREDIANCSVTAYEFDPLLGKRGKLALRLYNFVAPLEEAGEPITTKKDVPVAPK